MRVRVPSLAPKEAIMAKKLYHVGFDTISEFISQNRKSIQTHIHPKERFEIEKVFGRAYFELAIANFIKQFHIDKDLHYALYILNQLKSNLFIYDLYKKLQLSMFEEKPYCDTHNEDAFKDYQKSLFYGFVSFLYTQENTAKKKIQEKLFSLYFFHYIKTLTNPSGIHLEYKDMTLSYIKGKDIELKESYMMDEEKNRVNFKILINKEAVVQLEGKSVKTLRKKAYKKAFFYLIDIYKNRDDYKI